MLTLTCRTCGTPITGDTLEELTANVQAHASQHGHSRPISPEHIRARLKNQHADRNGREHNEHQHG